MIQKNAQEKRPRILVAGSFVMDQIASTEVFPKEGQSVLGSSFQKAPGGKGANQAVQAARLGAKTTLFGKLGDDANGDEMLEACRCAGIDVSPVIREKGASSGCAVVILQKLPDGSVQNRILVIPGTNMTISPREADGLEGLISRQDMVMLQLEIPMEVNLKIAAAAAKAGVPVMLNPAPSAPLPDELLCCLTYISPNETEVEDLTGIHIGRDGRDFDRDAAMRAAGILRARGVKNVLITLGSAGAVFLGDQGFAFSPAVRGVTSADPTAAGDSFIAAFCCRLCLGADVEDAMSFANHTAAITVSRVGAMPSLPTAEEVRRFMEDRCSK